MGLCQSRNKENERGTNLHTDIPTYPRHQKYITIRKRNPRSRKRPAPNIFGHDEGINQASLINQPKGHQGAHFNQGSATLPAPDLTTTSCPISPISGPAKQTQGLQENRSDAVSGYPKTTEQSQTTNKTQPVNTAEIVQVNQKYSTSERAHASDNSESSHKNSQIRRNKMMNSSPLDDQNAYETKPNFPRPVRNFEIRKTDECTPNTEMDAQHRHNYDANKPKGHQGAHFNQGSATLPAPDLTTTSCPIKPISGPAKQTQGLQENRSDAITTESVSGYPKTTEQSQPTNKTQPVNTPEIVQVDQKYSTSERAHASDNSESSHKNSQIRRNKMMNSSPLDDQNAYETKPNFPRPVRNFEIRKTDECTPNTEMDAQHRHNYDANKPKGHQGAHFNQGSATLPAPDLTTTSCPIKPISGPAKQTQGLQENRSDAITTESVSGYPKTTEQSQPTNKTQPVNTPEIVQVEQKYSTSERAHASDNSESSHKNSQIRRNKMMNSSPLDEQNAYEMKPNFPPPDENIHIHIHIHRHNYDANKGGTSSSHTYQGAENSAILEGQQNSINAMSDFSNKIDERESNTTLETNLNLTISTREEPCKAITGVSNCPPQLSEAEMKRKIDELNSLYKSMNKPKIEIENYRDGKRHARYYYFYDQVLKLMYKVDDVKLDRYSPLRKNKLQLSKDLDQLDDLLKTKA